jgi:hypothetical protein
MSSTLTLTSGSSIVGEGPSTQPQSEIDCSSSALSGAACIQGTDDYAAQGRGYLSGSRLEHLRIECSGTGCSNGLNLKGAGIGAALRDVTIDGTGSDCLVIQDANSNDWTESFSAENVFLTSCGRNGVTLDVSAGGFFNDGQWTNLQVRSSRGYFVQMNSGSTSNVAIARQTFTSLHGFLGSGIWFQNGGGAITGITFLTPEVEGNPGTAGYPFDGNLSANSATHVAVIGLGYTNFSAGMLSPHVSYDLFTSSATLGGLNSAGSCVALANNGSYSCTHSFANPYPSPPACVANAAVSAANVWVAVTASSVTLFANYQGAQINWACYPAAN